MKICYADPPYIGQAEKHYGDQPLHEEVDHAKLIRQLMDYDGWALSASSVSILELARLQDENGEFVMPWYVRVGVWVKPFASFKPNVNPAYAWEPVFFVPARKRGREYPTIRDWVSASITLERGVHGAKPETFCYWLFEVLGMDRDDEFIDMYPGSGAVTNAYTAWQTQMLLRNVIDATENLQQHELK